MVIDIMNIQSPVSFFEEKPSTLLGRSLSWTFTGLKTILNREPEELTRRIYDTQIIKPYDGDFVALVAKDFDKL